MTTPLDDAIAAHRSGDAEGACRIVSQAIADKGPDPLLLHFLGMIESSRGNVIAARNALERAASPPFNHSPSLLSLARLLARTGDMESLATLSDLTADPLAAEFLMLRGDARYAVGDVVGAAADAVALVRRTPADRGAILAAARLLAESDQADAAAHHFRLLLDVDPTDREGLIGLTGVLEALSKADELAPLFAAARAGGAEADVLALGDAIALRRDGQFSNAVQSLEAARPLLPEGTYFQMRGELLDRAGDYDSAFGAFAAMNESDRLATPHAAEGVARYRSHLDHELASLQCDSECAPPDERRPPLFLLGFPRSGTTLLDTFLMGSPGVEVHEERGFLSAAAAAVPGTATATGFSSAQAETMRAAYWQALGREARNAGALQVDKNPLASAEARSIHVMFPGAPILFALRHPCDVVLSCFVTRFRLNWATSSFLTIQDAAATYCRVMEVWSSARARLGMAVTEIRYEELIDDPEASLRGIAATTGIAFDPHMLDHREAASARGMITSASHAQVVEPLYSRSVGRWRNYADQMQPVLDMLAPWCSRFGYSLEA